MKKNLTKLGYMAFGCLLTLIGYHFGNVDNNSANAQITVRENAPIVDEVRCRKLVIVGDDNTPRIKLSVDLLDWGVIEIAGKDQIRRVYVGVDTLDGFESGIIELSAKDSGSNSVALGTDLYGGYMALYNRIPASRKPVVHASITPEGRGAIVVRDTTGQQTDSMYGGFPAGFQTRNLMRALGSPLYLRD